MFQLSRVAGALARGAQAIDFKAGVLIMAAFYPAPAGAWAVRFFRGRARLAGAAQVP